MAVIADNKASMDVVLRDGSTVQLRRAVADDAAALQHLLDGLSRESLYSRFFTFPNTPREVARLLASGDHHGATLVAELSGGICAVANYVRPDQASARAEVAFAIADALQGKGI